MFSQLWSGARTRQYRAARVRGRPKSTFRPGMDWLDERCLPSALVVTQVNQADRAAVDAGGAAALVAFTIPASKAAPPGSVAEAASPPLVHNAGASSSTTIDGTGISSLLASATGPTVLSTTELSPNLFATPLVTTVPASASAPTTAQAAGIPFSQVSAPATPRTFGQSPPLSREQVGWSARLDLEDKPADNEATVSVVGQQKQANRLVKVIEKSESTVPSKARLQRSESVPEPELLPIRPDKRPEPELDIGDHGYFAASFGAVSYRPGSPPEESKLSQGFWAMVGAISLSGRALDRAIAASNRHREAEQGDRRR
jgi:hypothetical protein